jgi:hypothetical protein
MALFVPIPIPVCVSHSQVFVKGVHQALDIRLWGFLTYQTCMGIGDLGTRSKNEKEYGFGLKIVI